MFRAIRPRTPAPETTVEFCRFANPDSFIRLENGRLHVRISDLLQSAPAPVMEALAFILIGKLYRKPVGRQYPNRYRLYLNRKDVRRQAQLIRQIRGRKFISGPQGEVHNLEEVFERLNAQFFNGMLGLAATGLEPQCVAPVARPFRPIAQRHRHQPHLRPPADARGGARLRDVPRDAAPALSGGPQPRAPLRAYPGIQSRRKRISSVERGQRNIESSFLIGGLSKPRRRSPRVPACAIPPAWSRTASQAR